MSSQISSGALRGITKRRLLTLCLLLMIGLAAANLLFAGVDQRESPLTGAPGALLYAAGFDEFQDEWTLYDGRQRAQIVDGELEIAVSAAQTAAWSSARYVFGDFDMRVSVRAIAGPEDNGYGIIFGLEDSSSRGCDLPAVILCGLEDLLPLAGAALRGAFGSAESESYRAFLISSDGYYSLWHARDGAARLRSAWMPAPQIKLGIGAENRIRVVGEGGEYRFFINGASVPLCLPHDAESESTFYGGECIDGALSQSMQSESAHSGLLGFIAQTTPSGGGGIVLRFDDVVISSPTKTNQEARL